MTAPEPTPDVREALAAWFAEHVTAHSFEHSTDDDFADALLASPALAALKAEWQAAALEAAAGALPGFDGIRTHGDAARWLRDRAARLRGGDS